MFARQEGTHFAPISSDLLAPHAALGEEELVLAGVVADDQGQGGGVDELKARAQGVLEAVHGGDWAALGVGVAAEPELLRRELAVPGEGRGDDEEAAGAHHAALAAHARETAVRAGQAVNEVAEEDEVKGAQAGRQAQRVHLFELHVVRAGLARALGNKVLGQHAVGEHRVGQLALGLDLGGSLDKGGAEVDADRLVKDVAELEGDAAGAAAEVEGARGLDVEALGQRLDPGADALRVVVNVGAAAAEAELGLAKVQVQELAERLLLRVAGHSVVGLLAAAEGVDADKGAGVVHAGGDEGRVLLVGLDQAEARVLVEVRAEVEAGKDAGLVARADKGAAHDDVVLAVEAGQAKVLVVRVDLEAGQGVEVVLAPLPDVAGGVVHAGRGRRQGVDGALRHAAQVEVGHLLQHLLAAQHHDGVAGHAERLLEDRVVADGLVLGLGQQAVLAASSLAVLLGLPGGVGLGLVVVDNGRPVPLHVGQVKGVAQLVLVQAGRARRHPVGRVAHVAEGAPLPALGCPELLLGVAAALDKLVELAVGDLVLGDAEGLDLHGLLAVLVVPAEGREGARLAELHAGRGHADKLVLREVDAARRRQGAAALGRGVVLGHVLRPPHQPRGQLADQHAARLNVDALVLRAEQHRPERAVLQLRPRLKGRVVLNHVDNHVVDLLAVGGDL
eukprot:m.129645 g.129645  ORF g.129645 m.129645 type:complete len:675 (-) comp16411_c0_seq1:409-2433(-)